MFGFLAPNVPQISADDVKQALDRNQDVLILDVRTPGEFAKNRIKGAINIPVDQIENKIQSVIPDKNKKTYVYCLSASRSVHAVNAMTKFGYTDVYNLTSGLLAWRAKQYPLE
jgi:rhodanese-related sulfurtransferase